MTTNPLLSAVLADPFDDLPRLVYADWLDENDEQERAEFIRTQIDDPEADQWELLFDLAYVFFPDAEGEYCNQPKNTIKILHADKSKVEYVFRRGFPDEIRCTMVQWVGGECGRCHGRGFLGGPAPGQHGWIGAPTCPRCHGTGRTPGIAKQVCEAWPVTKVVLTDRKPHYRHISGGYRAPSWLSDSNQMYATGAGYQLAVLPESLHAIVRELDESHICGDDYECFEEENVAYETLSHAALAYGRRLAGLPEIQFTQPSSPPR